MIRADKGVRCTVRLATVDDLGAVLDLHADQGNRPRVRATDTERRTWARMMQTPDLRVYVAQANEDVVGTASVMIMPNITYECAPTVFIEAVLVSRSHRRRGHATRMLQRILSDVDEFGCGKVQLLSHKRHADDGAHSLYERLGFVAEAEGFRLYLRAGP